MSVRFVDNINVSRQNFRLFSTLATRNENVTVLKFKSCDWNASH